MQNRSNAVMASRVEAHDSLDYFPTMPWGTRALCEKLDCPGERLSLMTVWEPACGTGDMARPLAEYFQTVIASDVHDYGFGVQGDFLFPYPPRATKPDWIITNPPFRLGYAFAAHALLGAKRGVALLVRTAFLEGKDRHDRLFKPNPPQRVLQFVERLPMVKGRLSKTASTATSYCWVVWRTDRKVKATALEWIEPCRKRLEKDSDYPLSETSVQGVSVP